ncbi:MAG: carbon-nitrogen hydrolase [Lasallia pustulata]|uniref:Carbon-nitrogen hydrolase n=1 Tax=Lasallia pustulata TaxID=136370 RepID=A0A5M8PS39_9LECA|nr:MAG: carbon-nitrogen hydrolase [Lasallia pustulata]
MRIAILQFSPTLGAPRANLSRASALLSAAASTLTNIDLLVLPELAFSGYNFPSLEAITPFLEPRAHGPSAEWARGVAAWLGAVVVVGYPEKGAGEAEAAPDPAGAGRNYNALIALGPAARPAAGWRTAELPLARAESAAEPGPAAAPTTRTTLAICMDLNPAGAGGGVDLATHVRDSGAALLLLSMAWLSPLPAGALPAAVPDTATLGYWVSRLEPLRAGAEEVVVVVANRCGEEAGGARYSEVMTFPAPTLPADSIC